MSLNISYTAILVAAIAGFVFSAIWYTALFGKTWAKEMGFDMNQKPEPGFMVKSLVMQFIGLLLLSYVFTHNIAAWQFVPGTKDAPWIANAISAAVFTCVGFYVPTELGRVAWERKSWKLFIINVSYHLISLIIMALIITKWIQ